MRFLSARQIIRIQVKWKNMKKKIASTFIVLTLALLSTVIPALAKSERTAITGMEYMSFGIPAKVWLADGLVQQRGVPLTGTFNFGVMGGTEIQISNATLDPGTGNGRVWGTVTYTDTATGVTCSGVREGKLENFLITATINAPCSDGSLLKGTLQDVLVIVPPGSPVPTEVHSSFTGELLSPN